MESAPNRNPQAAQMADESMVRCLAAQAEAVWPQERPLLEALGLPAAAEVLDVACGTGEFSFRLAQLLPACRLIGIDLVESHLELARERCSDLRDTTGELRTQFSSGDAFHLNFDDARFDLVACRHFLQAIPEPERVVAELARVTRPGGWVHVVAEDYAMMHFDPDPLGSDHFWQDGPMAFGHAVGFDLRIGRKMFGMLRAAGLEDVSVNFVSVDTTRVPREVFAAIWIAWRDGYSEGIAEHSRFEVDEVRAHFDAMITAIQDPAGFGSWLLPLVQARKPI